MGVVGCGYGTAERVAHTREGDHLEKGLFVHSEGDVIASRRM